MSPNTPQSPFFPTLSLTWSSYFHCHSSTFFLILAFSLQTGFTGRIPFSNTSSQWENIPIWPYTIFIMLWNILRPTSSLRLIKWLISLKKWYKNNTLVQQKLHFIWALESYGVMESLSKSFVVIHSGFDFFSEYDVYSTICKHSLTAFEVQLTFFISIKHKLFLKKL